MDVIDDELDDIIDKLEITALPTFAFYNNSKLIEIISGGNPIILKLKTENLAKLQDKAFESNSTSKIENSFKLPISLEQNKNLENNIFIDKELIDVVKAKDYIKLTHSGKVIAYYQADWFVIFYILNFI